MGCTQHNTDTPQTQHAAAAKTPSPRAVSLGTPQAAGLDATGSRSPPKTDPKRRQHQQRQQRTRTHTRAHTRTSPTHTPATKTHPERRGGRGDQPRHTRGHHNAPHAHTAHPPLINPTAAPPGGGRRQASGQGAVLLLIELACTATFNTPTQAAKSRSSRDVHQAHALTAKLMLHLGQALGHHISNLLVGGHVGECHFLPRNALACKVVCHVDVLAAHG